MTRSAIIDKSGRFRYLLTRQWGIGAPVLFIMLNPSSADGEKDDPTIRKCIGFAQRWQRPGIEVVNLFAYRATDPMDLRDCLSREEPPIDPIGAENNAHILAAADRAGFIVAAWGNHSFARNRAGGVRDLLRWAGHGLNALRIGKSGQPWHPLYVPYEQATEVFQ